MELDIAVKHSEIRILEEEKTAKEEEIDTQNRIILGNTNAHLALRATLFRLYTHLLSPFSHLEMEKEILNLQREKQADIDAKISEILGNF